MELISKMLLGIAIFWTIWNIVQARSDIRSGKLVMLPFVSSNLVFAVFIILVVATGISPFHLLWLFILSIILGFALLIFPFWTKFIMAFLSFLAFHKN